MSTLSANSKRAKLNEKRQLPEDKDTPTEAASCLRIMAKETSRNTMSPESVQGTFLQTTKVALEDERVMKAAVVGLKCQGLMVHQALYPQDSKICKRLYQRELEQANLLRKVGSQEQEGQMANRIKNLERKIAKLARATPQSS